MLSYANALLGTASEIAKTTVRIRRLLFAGFVPRKKHLPKIVMFRDMLGGKVRVTPRDRFGTNFRTLRRTLRRLVSNLKCGARPHGRSEDGLDRWGREVFMRK